MAKRPTQNWKHGKWSVWDVMITINKICDDTMGNIETRRSISCSFTFSLVFCALEVFFFFVNFLTSSTNCTPFYLYLSSPPNIYYIFPIRFFSRGKKNLYHSNFCPLLFRRKCYFPFKCACVCVFCFSLSPQTPFPSTHSTCKTCELSIVYSVGGDTCAKVWDWFVTHEKKKRNKLSTATKYMNIRRIHS